MIICQKFNQEYFFYILVCYLFQAQLVWGKLPKHFLFLYFFLFGFEVTFYLLVVIAFLLFGIGLSTSIICHLILTWETTNPFRLKVTGKKTNVISDKSLIPCYNKKSIKNKARQPLTPNEMISILDLWLNKLLLLNVFNLKFQFYCWMI